MRKLALIPALLLATQLSGQVREFGPLILQLPANTAAAAMGGAFQVAGSSSDAVFFNPALLGRAQGVSIAAQRFDSRSSYLTISGTTELFGGGIAVGLQTLSYSTDASLVGMIAPAEGDLLTGGANAASELVATLGYGTEVFGLNVGVAAKAIEMRLRGAEDVALAIDIGIAKSLGPVWLSLAGQNLGQELDLSGELTVEGGEFDLTNRVTLSAGVDRILAGPFDLGFTGGVTREAGGTVIPSAGAQVAWWPVIGRTFIGRVGVRRVDDGSAHEVSFGGGMIFDRFSIDYAFQGFGDGLGTAHRVGFSWR